MKFKYILYALIIATILYYFAGYFTSSKNQANTFVIARDPQFHPLELMGKELDIQLFCDHLVQQIAKTEGFEAVIESVQNEHLLPGLQKKDYDAIMVPIVEDWGNIGHYYFSDVIFSLAPVLVVRVDEKSRSFTDFKGKTIGIIRSSNLMSRVNTIPSINIAPYDRLFDGFDNLISDRIDGFIMDALPAYLYTEGFYKGKLRIYQPALTNAGIKLATLQTPRAAAFIEKFNKGLSDLMESKGYQDLLTKWDFEHYPLPPIKVQNHLPLED